VVVVQIGHVTGEVGEVVAHAYAEIRVDGAIHAQQPASARAVVHVGAQPAVFGQGVPLERQVVTRLDRGEVGGAVVPGTGAAVDAGFTLAMGQLADELPVLVELIGSFSPPNISSRIWSILLSLASALAASGALSAISKRLFAPMFAPTCTARCLSLLRRLPVPTGGRTAPRRCDSSHICAHSPQKPYFSGLK
jgi:hypothetical protein